MSFFTKNIPFTIALFACILFMPFIGLVHLFDWDEINFAECAREMLVSGNYMNLQMNYKPFWEKPPLFIWLAALSMKAFGVNEFAARFPNAVCGIVTLIILFMIGRKFYGQMTGLFWALCYAASTLPQFYFKSGIIDPWFNLFIFGAVYFFLRYTSPEGGSSKTQKIRWLLLCGLMSGLAILTKGPAAVVIIGLCGAAYYISGRFRNMMPVPHILLLLLVIVASGGAWFILLLLQGKDAIIENFISYQVHLFQAEDAGHGGPIYYHFLVLFFGCFPASVFAIRSFRRDTAASAGQRHFHRWMLILFWVVLILFSVVKTKIIHYSSLCYFPLTFLAAYTISQIWDGKYPWKKWMNYLLVLSGGLFSLVLMLLPLVDVFKEEIIAADIIKDQMAVENLKADVHWSGFEWLIGSLGIVTIIYAIILSKRQKFRMALLVVLGGNLLTTHLASIVIVPKIEGYTQAAVIGFYKDLQGKDVYVESLNYLSYAQYFYAQKMPLQNKEAYSRDWLLHGPIDKDTYFVSKVTLDEMNKEDNPEMREIGRKNGFVFYLRSKKADH